MKYPTFIVITAIILEKEEKRATSSALETVNEYRPFSLNTFWRERER